MKNIKNDVTMKLFLLGDFESDNGPGNANKQIRNSLAERNEINYSRASGKLMRMFEMYAGIKHADILLICSMSKMNFGAIRIAKKMGKKIIYLMHGYASYETKIENPSISEKEIERIRSYETYVYSAVDRIVCVSKYCMDFMKKQFPQYGEKFDYIYNAVEVEFIKKICRGKNFLRQKNKLLSVGGGMRRKNNLIIAKSIDKFTDNLEYTVVGYELEDGKSIKEFAFVTWFEHLPHKELIYLMNQSELYIQNSSFETFGLAVIEALYAGCSLLISDKVGCKDMFETIKESDLIYDVTNEEEISGKIKYLLQEPNNERLLNGFKETWVSKRYQGQRWNEIIETIRG